MLALKRRAQILASALTVVSCGGTTGREDLPMESGAGLVAPVDASVDAMETDDGGLYTGEFDVAIVYADRELPDVSAPIDATVGAGETDGGDAGPSLVPCTTAGQTQCVSCQGNAADGGAGGLCTPTEALLVELDIARGSVTDAGSDPYDPNNPGVAAASGCYTCLYNSGCLDDTTFGDTGHECGDLPSGDFASGDGTTDMYSTLCLATLQCILGSGCALTNGGPTNCYCGSGGGSQGQCPKNGPATDGVCKGPETDGFKFTPNDSTDILKNYSDNAEPSGVANQILVCANANSCFQCLP
jgi:hypothetical protein